MPKVCVAEPHQYSEVEIDDFVALVQGGGEVDPDGFRDRVIERGVALSFVREGNCLLGVAGLKRPVDSYRRGVESGAKTKVPADAYPFELGWVFIMPSARGKKLSYPLCEPIVASAKGAGIFATSRAGNPGMHATLLKLGFVRTGAEWKSKQNPENLALFLRKQT